MDEELMSLQLDKPSYNSKTKTEKAGHTIAVNLEEKPLEKSIYLLREGDNLQKICVIKSIPKLLKTNQEGTVSRVLPKIQQELSQYPIELHIATADVFSTLIMSKAPVSVLGSIIQGCQSKDPIISTTWIDCLLEVLPYLSSDDIKQQVITLAVSKAQINNSVLARITSCRLLGAIAVNPQLEPIYVKTNILPTVQLLCQDNLSDVRMEMCSNLHLIAKGLGLEFVQRYLLSNLVELASDDKDVIRSTALLTSALMIPYLPLKVQQDTIVPLIKQLCSKAYDEYSFPSARTALVIGKLFEGLGSNLEKSTGLWFLQLYKTLSVMGNPGAGGSIGDHPAQALECRETCAKYLPAVTNYIVTTMHDQYDYLETIISDLGKDSYYLVRKTVADNFYDIFKILGQDCVIVKNNLLKLLRDETEEVLTAIIQNLGQIMEHLCLFNVISVSTIVPYATELTKAILKCKAQLGAQSFKWRVHATLLQQLEILPNTLPSDYIHQHFTPMIIKVISTPGPHPVRSQAIRTMLIILRYNIKETQRKWIRDNLISELCYSKNSFTRIMFIKLCEHALQLFSNNYFKTYFFEYVVKLADDPTLNVRYYFIGILPQLLVLFDREDERKTITERTILANIVDVHTRTRLDNYMKTKLMKEKKPKRDIAAEKRLMDEERAIFQGILPCLGQKKPRTITEGHSPTPILGGSNSNLSFLEQSFYIDAGISLPIVDLDKSNDILSLDIQKRLKISNKASTDQKTKHGMEQFQVSSNITDDFKVTLRNTTKVTQKKTLINISNDKLQNKRHSSIITSTTNTKKTINRRSLNVATDLSRIPVSLQKTKSSIEFKRTGSKNVSLKDIGVKSDGEKILQKGSSDSDLCKKSKSLDTDNKSIDNTITDTSRKSDSKSIRTSALPVLKRKTQK